MAVTRITFTLDSELADQLRALAADRGDTVSSVVEDQMAKLIRRANLLRAGEEYQAEHGAFTPDELDRAAAGLGLPPRYGTGDAAAQGATEQRAAS